MSDRSLLRPAGTGAAERLPLVSVVIPCRNEERHVEKMLAQFSVQTYRGEIEIIIIDGMSTDRTREVIGSCLAAHPHINCRVIENRNVHIPAGLNLGISEAKGEYIIRMDAHAVPAADYIEKTVETLVKGRDIAGGVCITRPGDDTAVADLIAEAFSHPFGVGDSLFRLHSRVKEGRLIDTVPFGSFRKTLWEELGGFNEEYIVHQDYEFNYRARSKGKSVYLNPAIVSSYYARKNLREVWVQLSRYGSWKLRMLLSHPDSLKLRHAVPPLFLLSMAGLPLLGIFWKPALYLWAGEIVVYTAASAAAAVSICRSRGFAPRLLGLPAVFLVMHAAYGTGMLWQFLKRGWKIHR